jgi:hypothetical protein
MAGLDLSLAEYDRSGNMKNLTIGQEQQYFIFKFKSGQI